jgi:plasmid stabilization system protein ParE
VSFQFHPDARNEFREAVLSYGRAAESFVNAVEAAIAAIILKPDRFREFEPGVRTCRVSKFPYSILYTLRENDIMILAVKHDRRDPDYWRYRLDR